MTYTYHCYDQSYKLFMIKLCTKVGPTDVPSQSPSRANTVIPTSDLTTIPTADMTNYDQSAIPSALQLAGTLFTLYKYVSFAFIQW